MYGKNLGTADVNGATTKVPQHSATHGKVSRTTSAGAHLDICDVLELEWIAAELPLLLDDGVH